MAEAGLSFNAGSDCPIAKLAALTGRRGGNLAGFRFWVLPLVTQRAPMVVFLDDIHLDRPVVPAFGASLGEYDDLLQVIEKIHAAATAPGVRQLARGALASLTRLIGGVGATIELIDRGRLVYLMFQSWGVPSSEELAYLQQYAALSPRIGPALEQRPGELAWDYQILDEEEIDGSIFYSHFLKPMDMRYAVACILATPANQFAALAVQRSARHGHVGPEQLALMARVLPHASQALDVARRLNIAQQRAQPSMASLDLACATEHSWSTHKAGC